jgi:hypothetical protein
MIVGHEIMPDDIPWATWEQYRAAGPYQVELFLRAMQADLAGDPESIRQRDAYLEQIMGFEELPVEPRRTGNSTEDLLLSLKGWELGCMVKNRSMADPQGVATWLENNLAELSCCP